MLLTGTGGDAIADDLTRIVHIAGLARRTAESSQVDHATTALGPGESVAMSVRGVADAGHLAAVVHMAGETLRAPQGPQVGDLSRRRPHHGVGLPVGSGAVTDDLPRVVHRVR